MKKIFAFICFFFSVRALIEAITDGFNFSGIPQINAWKENLVWYGISGLLFLIGMVVLFSKEIFQKE